MNYCIVSALSDVPYLLWQVELQIFNFGEMTDRHYMQYFHVVICSTEAGGPSRLAKRLMTLHPFPENVLYVNTESYKVETDKYPALFKPLGLECFLRYRRQLGLNPTNILLLDPDVLFSNDPITTLHEVSDRVLKSDHWYFSNCSSYLDITAYRKKGYTDDELRELCKVFDCTIDVFEKTKWCTGGAQYFFGHDITPEFCQQVRTKARRLYEFICTLPGDRNPWFAEMLAWHMVSISSKGSNNVKIHSNMDFLLVDSLLSDRICMLHLSGDCKKRGAFDKTLFTQAPWHVRSQDNLREQCKQINIKWAGSVYLYWLIKYMDKLKL